MCSPVGDLEFGALANHVAVPARLNIAKRNQVYRIPQSLARRVGVLFPLQYQSGVALRGGFQVWMPAGRQCCLKLSLPRSAS